jgi:hypothetical protein
MAHAHAVLDAGRLATPDADGGFHDGRLLCDHRPMSAEPEHPHRGRVLGWSIVLLLGVLAALFVLCVGQKYLD